MLCYVMLCHAVLCYSTLFSGVIFYDMIYNVALCCATLYYVTCVNHDMHEFLVWTAIFLKRVPYLTFGKKSYPSFGKAGASHFWETLEIRCLEIV